MKVGVKEINAETGEEIFYERELTAAEVQIVEEREAEQLAAQAEAEEKAAAKAAVLEQLGITEEQAKLLLS